MLLLFLYVELDVCYTQNPPGGLHNIPNTKWLLFCSMSWPGQFKVYFCFGVLGNSSFSSTVPTSWKPWYQTSLLSWNSSHSDESMKASVCASNHGHIACVSADLPLVNESCPGRHSVRLLLLPQRRDKATRSGPPAVWNRLTPLFLSARLPLDTIATGRNRTVLLICVYSFTCQRTYCWCVCCFRVVELLL